MKARRFIFTRELALAVTLESVTLPADLVGWLDGRSSLARWLMVHVTAHRIDPGWSGCIVLEFYNPVAAGAASGHVNWCAEL
ncbi:hypothetical protein ECZU29_39280 [Escherichia coli]|nr:hypothetical protein ECZU29_39280 [Escherichia coli]